MAKSCRGGENPKRNQGPLTVIPNLTPSPKLGGPLGWCGQAREQGERWLQKPRGPRPPQDRTYAPAPPPAAHAPPCGPCRSPRRAASPGSGPAPSPASPRGSPSPAASPAHRGTHARTRASAASWMFWRWAKAGHLAQGSPRLGERAQALRSQEKPAPGGQAAPCAGHLVGAPHAVTRARRRPSPRQLSGHLAPGSI